MQVQKLVQAGVHEFNFRRLHRQYRHYTMIPQSLFAGNLHLAATIRDIDGCVVECGTWRGGMIAGIAQVLGNRRLYYLCDSFEGLPAAAEIDGVAARVWQADIESPTYYDNCTASTDDAHCAMKIAAVTNYELVKGWFEETLPNLPARPIALLRMDADWYASTKCILDCLADRVVPGGLIVADDYHTWEGCTVAVNEFAAERKLRIRQSHHGVCYIVM